MSKTTDKFSPEVLERAGRPVIDNEGQHVSRRQAVLSISAKTDCAPQTLIDWVKKAGADSGRRAGVPTGMAEKMKALERKNRELRLGQEDDETLQRGVSAADEILRKASAYLRWRSSTVGQSEGGFLRCALECARSLAIEAPSVRIR